MMVYGFTVRYLKILALAAMWFLGSISINYAACNIVGGEAYGDCAGITINKGTKGHLIVRSYTSEGGIIDGATVLQGGSLEFGGTSNNNITVHEGGRLRITGIVNGTVNNLGGVVEIEGSVDHLHTTKGKVIIGGNIGRISGNGPIIYNEGAVIGGRPIKKSEH